MLKIISRDACQCRIIFLRYLGSKVLPAINSINFLGYLNINLPWNFIFLIKHLFSDNPNFLGITSMPFSNDAIFYKYMSPHATIPRIKWKCYSMCLNFWWDLGSLAYVIAPLLSQNKHISNSMDKTTSSSVRNFWRGMSLRGVPMQGFKPFFENIKDSSGNNIKKHLQDPFLMSICKSKTNPCNRGFSWYTFQHLKADVEVKLYWW